MSVKKCTEIVKTVKKVCSIGLEDIELSELDGSYPEIWAADQRDLIPLEIGDKVEFTTVEDGGTIVETIIRKVVE